MRQILKHLSIASTSKKRRVLFSLSPANQHKLLSEENSDLYLGITKNNITQQRIHAAF